LLPLKAVIFNKTMRSTYFPKGTLVVVFGNGAAVFKAPKLVGGQK